MDESWPSKGWRREARRLAELLATRDIQSADVLEQIASTPRHLFVAPELRSQAYADTALGIDCGQTISQPYIVALMTQAAELTGRENVLEIGTGSGYQTAILAKLARQVVTMERHGELTSTARQRLESLGLHNILYVHGDGTLGWPEQAPYDAILVTAAAPEVPDALWQQLAEGGRLVIPVGTEDSQQLLQVVRQGTEAKTRFLCDCRFVKLIGAQGFSDSDTE